MIEVDRTLSGGERALLVGFKGAEIISIEMALAAPPEVAWNTVRLHTDKGSFDVNCLLELAPVNDEGEDDDLGVVSVDLAPASQLEVPSIATDVIRLEIGRKIIEVEIVDDNQRIYENERLFYSRKTTKAIIFYTDEDCLVLDRHNWFDEMMFVTQGPDAESLLEDEWADWEDIEEEEPGIHYEFTMSRETL